MKLEEGKLTIHYHAVSLPDQIGIDTFFEGWIGTALKAFGYELVGSGMEEGGTRVLQFDKMTRN